MRERFAVRRLHADDGGQVSALAVLSAMAFACLLLLVINTGHSTSGKIQLQNAADMTATSGATWVARGLNVISLNNVTETQLVAVALIIPALDSTLTSAIATLEAQKAAVAAIPYVGAALAAVIQVQIVEARALQAAVRAARPLGGRNGALWRFAGILHSISTAVRASFFPVGELEAMRVAGQNGAEVGLLIPAGLRITLPVHDGALRPDLCEPMRNGSPTRAGGRGYSPLREYDYPAGVGPFELYSSNLKRSPIFWSLVNSFIHVYFEEYRQIEYVRVCGGSLPPTGRPSPVSEYQCRYGSRVGTAAWSVMMYESRWFDSPQSSIRESDMAGPARQVGQEMHPCSWNPPPKRTREVVEVVGQDANGRPIRRYKYEVTEYTFMSASQPGPPRTGPSPQPAPANSSDPRPYLLGAKAGDSADTVRRELRYLAVLYRTSTTTVAPRYFTSALGESRMAYAQVKVYNATPLGFDTFTQNWRVSLEPASLLEDPGVTGRAGSAPGGTAATSGLFNTLTGGLVGFFNNH